MTKLILLHTVVILHNKQHIKRHDWLRGKAVKLLKTICDTSAIFVHTFTVGPAKSDSDVMFCLQSYKGLRIDRSRVY